MLNRTELAQRLSFHREFQTSLAGSIVEGLRETTEPLTANLTDLRSEIGTLVTQVRTHDQKIVSGEDLKWVEQLGGQVRADMAEVARLTHEANQTFERHFRALEEKLGTILEISRQVEDLSQKINVLSINASIEAARAGPAGRGFKVIASEVKGLAHDTSTFHTQIEDTIHKTRGVFAGVGQDLETKRSGVTALLQKQKGSFEAFGSHFARQRADFEGLYRAILEFTNRLDGRIDQISPVVQLHEITVQELENLTLVGRDALDPVIQALEAETEGAPRVSEEPWAREVRNRLTTARELSILETIVGARGGKPPLESTHPPAIELF